MDEEHVLHRQQAKRNWDRARRRLWLERLLCAFKRCSNDLISFDEVQRKLRLVQGASRGVQQIPLARIRGSVGRYRDFTVSFLPRKPSLRERWERVDAHASARGMGPITVYQVGEAYFVLDGNHRASVARQAGMSTIEAHVIEFKGPVTLSARADLDELLIKTERAEFLMATLLDELRPRHGIAFTAPGRYRQVGGYIQAFQEKLGAELGRRVSDREAVEAWHDRVYAPVAREIEDLGVLDHFPGRTAADLFVWMWKHHKRVDELLPHRTHWRRLRDWMAG